MCGGGAAQGLVVLADVTGRGRESNTRVTGAAAVSRRSLGGPRDLGELGSIGEVAASSGVGLWGSGRRSVGSNS